MSLRSWLLSPWLWKLYLKILCCKIKYFPHDLFWLTILPIDEGKTNHQMFGATFDIIPGAFSQANVKTLQE